MPSLSTTQRCQKNNDDDHYNAGHSCNGLAHSVNREMKAIRVAKKAGESFEGNRFGFYFVAK